MQLTRHATAREFLQATQQELERREAEQCLVLGIALALAEPGAAPDAAAYLATVRDRRGLAVAALRTPPHPLLLASPRAEAPAAALERIARDVATGAPPGAALAAEPLAAALIPLWERITGHRPRVRMRQRLHALSRLREPAATSGRARLAERADRELVARWLLGFDADTLRSLSHQGAREVARRRVDAGEILLWEDPEPRAMAGRARPTRRTVAVNAVYTPPEHRGRGYATACVAELSRRLLAEYPRCVLFTDLANPTSNAIYARLGYRPLLDFALLELGPASADRGPGEAPTDPPAGHGPASQQDGPWRK